jgi:hypothetical protein
MGFLTPIRTAAFSALLACTNSLGGLPFSKESLGQFSTPLPGGPLQVTQVVQNPLQPTLLLDLIGDGSNQMGTLCKNAENKILCTCRFRFTNAVLQAAEIEVSAAYVEMNMIRCPVSDVPPETESVEISVVNQETRVQSNILTQNMRGLGSNMDASLTNNFSKVTSYTCAAFLNIPYLFGQPSGAFIDPIQSENKYLKFSKHFYATNLAQTAVSIAQGPNAEKWDCPPLFNHTEVLSPASATTFESIHELNPWIYSKEALNGTRQMAPTDPSGANRHEFYLATRQGSAFSVPLNALETPTTGTKVIGYGVLATKTSPTTEDCPDETVIKPAGFKWAKLWLFRASLRQRSYLKSTFVANQMNAVYCNPGNYTFTQNSTNYDVPVFPACYDDGVRTSTPPRSIALKEVDNSTLFLADRVIGLTPLCLRLTPADRSTAFCSNSTNIPATAPGPSCTASINNEYFDSYVNQNGVPIQLSTSNSAEATKTGCHAIRRSDPFGICSTNSSELLGEALTKDTSQITVQNLENPSGAPSEYDFIFVVTPPTLMLRDFQDSIRKQRRTGRQSIWSQTP